MSVIRVVGNYIHGQYGSTCNGAPIVGHLQATNLLVADNIIEIDAASSRGGCWGIDFDDGGYTTPVYLRNAKFSGNTIKNGGNVSLTVANCPDCVIENNLIKQNWAYGPGWSVTGILVPTKAARVGDDASTRNLVRNNTIWFGPNSTGGGTGIKVGFEGTGHVAANNTVYYSSISAGISGGVKCFDYPLELGSYAFINNNHCYSAAPYSWGGTRSSLAAWQATGFDVASSAAIDPKFTAIGTNFTPVVGSRLIGAGNTANRSVFDITGKTRPSPPAIGAYEP